ncbi:EpsG family protein [Treponema sp. UBA6852]|uniref:EpsG family protein n=1 Tax=Treponema sp. UBA6852 TaxID=1947744 RepID=UPI0025DF8575|nr:EpsG family protein [Treponema sp. UBA6852]
MLKSLIFVFCTAMGIFLTVVQENYKRTLRFSFSAFVFFLVPILCFALSRFFWADAAGLADYHNYFDFFNHADKVIENRFEIMAKVIRFFSPTFFIFLLFYSLTSITLKVYTIDKISTYPLLSLITYISTSFALHDTVQIRISCAIAIFLFSIRFLVERKYFIYILLISIAVCFHKSSAAFFVFLFFRKKSFNPAFWILALVVIYFSAFLNINFIKLFLLVLGEDNYYYLSIISDMNQNLDLFNVNQLINIFIFLLLAFNSRKFMSYKFFPIFMKIFFCSIAVYPLLNSVPIVASRFSEMLRPSIIFLLPLVINIFRQKWVGYIFVICICLMLSFLNNFYYSLVSI